MTIFQTRTVLITTNTTGKVKYTPATQKSYSIHNNHLTTAITTTKRNNNKKNQLLLLLMCCVVP
jgi:hypothetical protein